MCLHTHVFSCMCIYIHGYFWETFLYSCGHLIYLKRSHQKYPPWCCLAMGLGWMGWYMTDVGWFLQNVFFATWFYQDPSVLIQIYWHPWPPMVFDEDNICTIFRFPYVSWSSRIYRDRVPIYIYISPKLYELNPAAHEIVNPGMIYIRAPAGFCVLFLHGKIQRCHTKETPAVE
jgi:hypothetical protein